MVRRSRAFVAFNAKHILLRPYWFEENGHTVTIIHSERYITILDQFYGDLTQKLTQGQLRLAWFMQDGARPHTAHALLKHSSYVYGVFGAQRSRDCTVTVLVSQIKIEVT